MDTNQWSQAIGLVKPILDHESPKPPAAAAAAGERKPRPQKEQALNCPRCNSTNTKFCYYNNYSLTQPRYFCKTCRRYWTEGGTLRNVPVGGGSRKNKRSSISPSSISPQPPSSSSSSLLIKKLPVDLSHLVTSTFSQPPASINSQNPKIIHDGQDLNLAYPPTGSNTTTTTLSGLIHFPYSTTPPASNNHDDPNSNNNHHPSSFIINSSALELLKRGSSNGICPKTLTSLMSMPISVSSSTGFYSSLLPIQDYKPKLNFCVDGFDHDHHQNSSYGINSSSTTNTNATARLFLPYEDLKPLSMSSTTTEEQYDHHHQQQQQQQQQNRGQQGGESNGYWTGMLGGGSW